MANKRERPGKLKGKKRQEDANITISFVIYKWIYLFFKKWYAFNNFLKLLSYLYIFSLYMPLYIWLSGVVFTYTW